MPTHAILKAALDTVARACRVARQVQRDIDAVRRITKDDRSPVTVADFAVQAAVAMGLKSALGEQLIVGEESTSLLRNPEQRTVLDAVVSEVRSLHPQVGGDEVIRLIDGCNHDATGARYWTLDPIDGTKGFLRGQQYAIALALIEHGEVVLGVMGCPNLPADPNGRLEVADADGSMYAATLNGGAFEYRIDDDALRGRRIAAATFDRHRPVRACESVEAAHSKQDASARVLAELGAAGTPARLDSQCKYVVVARGQADVYLRIPTSKSYVEKIWDHAAGAIIASEAGAIVSDIAGSPLDFTRGCTLSGNRGIVCAVPGAHERVIQAIDKLSIEAAV